MNARAWFYSTGFNYSAQTRQNFADLKESLDSLEQSPAIEHLPHICKVAGCTYPRVRIDHKRSEYFCAKHLGLTDSLLGSREKVR